MYHINQESLARGTGRNVLALVALLSTGDAVATPAPVSAATGAAENLDLGGRALDATLDLVELDVVDLDAVGRLAGGTAVLVVLLDDDAVLGDARQANVLEAHVGDGSAGPVNSLDAGTILGVDDLGVDDVDGVDGVVLAAADGTDGETVAALAVTVGESDMLETVIFAWKAKARRE